MRRIVTAFCVLLVLAIVGVAAWNSGIELSDVEAFIERHRVAGAAAFVALFAASTVLPVSALPFLPLAARSYGVPATVFLTTAGWWIGCLAAFAIARSGRRYLERFTSTKALERFEGKMPATLDFGSILVLRVIFPGDIVGFALGLLRHVRFSTYAIASFIGTLPSAVLCSYAGGEAGRGQFLSTVLIVVAMILGAYLLRRWWRPSSKNA